MDSSGFCPLDLLDIHRLSFYSLSKQAKWAVKFEHRLV